MTDREGAFKLCIFGDGGVGKTTLVNRYLTKIFDEDIKMTVGADFYVKDLEIDGLIERRKKGRCTFVMITPEGKKALIHYSNMNQNTGSITDQIVKETINLLEQEGKISADWSSESRQEFINKVKIFVTEQLSSRNIDKDQQC